MSQQQTPTPRVHARGVAGLLLFVAAVVGALAPMPTATAAPTICVALVVDFTPLNGGVDSGCTRVPRGSNGYDVLRAGGHTYEICANGIIGTIDGQPANGCQIKDGTHFWGYWHRKPGSRTWTFSSYGAAVYHPGEGSTEGWVWENGKTSPPADTSYPAGCHSPPPASATPAPRPSSHSSPGGTSVPGGASSGGRTTRHPPSPGGSAAPRSPAHRRGSAATRTPEDPTTTVITTPTPTSTAGVPSAEPLPANDDGGGHTAPVAAGLGVAALLGAGAWWRSRRNGVGS
jgi:hypothetical protein